VALLLDGRAVGRPHVPRVPHRGEPRSATFFGPHARTYADPDEIAAEIASYGGRVIDRVEGTDLAPLGKENPVICRMEVSWTR
jgi:hypothetical protein